MCRGSFSLDWEIWVIMVEEEDSSALLLLCGISSCFVACVWQSGGMHISPQSMVVCTSHFSVVLYMRIGDVWERNRLSQNSLVYNPTYKSDISLPQYILLKRYNQKKNYLIGSYTPVRIAHLAQEMKETSNSYHFWPAALESYTPAYLRQL
jgi:hypothetical protein